MELVREVYRIRCEMGACKNFADYSVRMNRVGIRSSLHVCQDCLRELHALIGKNLKIGVANSKKGGGDVLPQAIQ